MNKDYKEIFDNLAFSITRKPVSSHPYDVLMYIADGHLCSMSGLVHMTREDALALANALYDDLGLGWRPYPENKPEKADRYIVAVDCRIDGALQVDFDDYDEYGGGWDWLRYWEDDQVKLWKPLPTLPAPYEGE